MLPTTAAIRLPVRLKSISPDVGADRVDGRVGHVQDAHDAVDQGEPERHQGVDRPGRDAVQKLFEE